MEKRDRTFSIFVKIFLVRPLDLSNRCSYNNRTKRNQNESGGDSGAGAISRDRSEKLLCHRRMRSPGLGSDENQSGSC